MYTKTFSCSRNGIDAELIHVEIDSSKGLPGFSIVGLADKSINEARERIACAMRACEFELPPQKILVNLSPAHIKKEGVHFDLAITAALMVNFGYINIEPELLENFLCLGELGLKGEIKAIKNLLIFALSKNIKTGYVIVPEANRKDAEIIQRVYGKSKKIFIAKNLFDLKMILEIFSSIMKADLEKKPALEKLLSKFAINENISNFKEEKEFSNLDFSDVLGQSLAKRAFEIAVAGNHHVLMMGPPGCGKTMLANRFINLLPKLSLKKAIETTKLHSAHGINTEGLIEKAPLRKPHHSASAVAFIGGGQNAIKPGEISLAHNGVLFLDEMTEFNRFTLEQLRQVLEEKRIEITRIKESQNLPADFILLAACNPCPCGYLGDTEINCRCSQTQIEKYLGKLSGPLLDRIDIHLKLTRLAPDTLKLLGKENTNAIKTETMLKNITKAKDFASKEKQSLSLDNDSESFMDSAIQSLKLSARSHQKIVKVARTIANMDQSSKIKEYHLAEALNFRSIKLN